MHIGGYSERKQVRDSVSIHYLDTNEWKEMPQRLNQARFNCGACVVDNMVYAVCGGIGEQTTDKLGQTHEKLTNTLERIFIDGKRDQNSQ